MCVYKTRRVTNVTCTILNIRFPVKLTNRTRYREVFKINKMPVAHHTL